jgi:hypothetical protein
MMDPTNTSRRIPGRVAEFRLTIRTTSTSITTFSRSEDQPESIELNQEHSLKISEVEINENSFDYLG